MLIIQHIYQNLDVNILSKIIENVIVTHKTYFVQRFIKQEWNPPHTCFADLDFFG